MAGVLAERRRLLHGMGDSVVIDAEDSDRIGAPVRAVQVMPGAVQRDLGGDGLAAIPQRQRRDRAALAEDAVFLTVTVPHQRGLEFAERIPEAAAGMKREVPGPGSRGSGDKPG